ncbi:hypothetical protein [Singulisphaera sp. GP187]|uniref:hypothetical protein n=1 Tax=Singulisphaera sp. GP187 TaxID=1882752 RepID=UPI00156EC71A|nr:hypothetical protein [Singulisphaera sp. GP187]
MKSLLACSGIRQQHKTNKSSILYFLNWGSLPRRIGRKLQLGSVRVQDRVGKVALLLLELEDLLFDRVPADQAVREHALGLADPVRTVDRLRFHRRVPPRVEQVHVFGRDWISV